MRPLVTLLFGILLNVVLGSGAMAAQPAKSGSAPAPPAAQPLPRVLFKAQIQAIAEDQSVFSVKDAKGAATSVVAGKEFKPRLQNLRSGDRVNVEVIDERKEEQKDGGKEEVTRVVLRDITAATIISASRWRRIWVLTGSGLVALVVTVVLVRKPFPGLIVGKDGRYSNSKFQMVAWFGALIVSYVAIAWIRAWDGGCACFGEVNIPQNLLLLSGLSALTFGAAKGITADKVAEARREAREAGKDEDAAAKAVKPDTKDRRVFL